MITEEVDQSRMDSVSDGKQIFSTLLSFCVWLGKGHIVFDISGSFWHSAHFPSQNDDIHTVVWDRHYQTRIILKNIEK